MPLASSIIFFLLLFCGMLVISKLPVKSKFIDHFKHPVFQKTLGIIAILFVLFISFNAVKVTPPIIKFGIVGLDFIIIYAIVTEFFTKTKTNL